MGGCMKLIDLDEKKFKKIVIDNKEEIIVDFYADWCGPCKMMAPIIESIAEDDNSFKVARINTDEAEDLSREYGIMSIPCIIHFKDGKEVNRSVGLVSKDDLLKIVGE